MDNKLLRNYCCHMVHFDLKLVALDPGTWARTRLRVAEGDFFDE
jgi:hypothetical protein